MKNFFTLVIALLLLQSCTSTPSSTPTPSPTATQEAEKTPSTLPGSSPTADPFISNRQSMVAGQIAARGVQDPAVLAAMHSVPRHAFVPEEFLNWAYNDQPLPIGLGQTISQPYMVALMTEQLGLSTGDRVLEIGTGSGYQAAILAEMGMEVYTVEILPELATRASKLLKELGYTSVQTLTADGYFGWEEHAPYDAIIVTAAPDHLPQPLTFQLKEGGRLVVPIGPQGSLQTLWLFEKVAGDLTATNLGLVTFVPFTRSPDGS